MTGPKSEGERTRRAVLGDAHVDAAIARTTEFDAPRSRYDDQQSAWERVWSRPDWSHRERLDMVTMFAAGGPRHEDELPCTSAPPPAPAPAKADIREALLHVGI